ncbi:MAG: AsmA-like C-terminal region-containing protein [Acidobacteriota bacterium]|nr:AsmA-like C-terminal region-containing protein [Acidobacteriota bacterium]
MFVIRKVQFLVDLGTLSDERKTVEDVWIEGMQITIPPKGERPHVPVENNDRFHVIIKDVRIGDAQLVILPRDQGKAPLKFQIQHLTLRSNGLDGPMNYEGALTIPKPPGLVKSHGSFGPWAAGEPGDTPLAGEYTFDKADLGVFNAIAGTLNSSGRFDGTLDSVHAKGEASVPDFRLKAVGNRVPLFTRFEVEVDGTNGDTILKPVSARLGKTSFTTTGAVIRHEEQRRHAINLKVIMPDGDLRDLLRISTKKAPFMVGRITLNTTIGIPPFSGPVKEKLALDGRFEVRDARFMGASIQAQVDQLSRRGQGQPKNEEIEQVLSNMRGAFRLENEVMTFQSLSFGVPGADVDLAGVYDMDKDTLDFHGALKLDAKVSQTMSGWKRWALKPVDPFFAKNGAGTYLQIQVVGSSRQPKFGRGREGK